MISPCSWTENWSEDPSSRPEAHQIVKVLKQALDDQIKLARDDGM